MKTVAALLGLLTLLTLPAACKAPHAGRTYTTRGQVVQLPDPAQPGSGLYLSHEAIDEFVDREGKTVGMDPMSMPFPVAKGVSLKDLHPADVVDFDLTVDWQAETPVEITRIRKLPPDTRLVFRAAKPKTPKTKT